ncbi:hypothetical protein DY000_02054554 [Brassica cretica]|uniref:Uncharacterized protein n=1 Tax=Brassica cretica TaxID=69181 RepID=A0ABQ7A6N1_BRACR|nr:hypothetical protein DY000_02054554 [Brassica cretica]
MQNPWRVQSFASGPSLPPSTSGELPPPLHLPPDPPDPTSSLSPLLFPPLSATSPSTKSRSKTALVSSQKGILKSPSSPPSQILDVIMAPQAELENLSSPSQTSHVSGSVTPPKISTYPVISFGNQIDAIINATNSPITASESHLPIQYHTLNPNPSFNPNFSVMPPKHSSPLLTNRASAPNPQPPDSNAPFLASDPLAPPINPSIRPQTTHPSASQNYQTPKRSLVEKLRLSEDKLLTRLAPVHVSLSETGRPRIMIPDHVSEKGAELHKDFIVCYYNGKPPPFNQIQSVLNYM